jgi:phosphate/sulfate permease
MHPVTYEADYAEERNRLTTFFRIILAIPWLIVFLVYAIGSLFVTIAAWFALIFIARYPDPLRRYNTGFLRFHVRVLSWLGLQTDEWPPFGFGEEPSYPVRVNVVAPERQSRAKVFFRLILAFPAVFMSFAIGLVQAGAALVTRFSIVFRGYQPRAAHDAFTYAFTYATRLYAYYGYIVYYYIPVGGLLVDEYPPLGDDGYARAKARKAAGESPPPPPAPAA